MKESKEHFKKLEEIKSFLENQSIEEFRKTTTPNDILLYRDYGIVVLRNNKQIIKGITYFSKEDLDLIKNHKWHLAGNDRSVETHINKKNIKMHHFILNFKYDKKVDLEVDHINRNHFDNRRENLRIVSRSINQQNKSCSIKIKVRGEEHIFYME